MAAFRIALVASLAASALAQTFADQVAALKASPNAEGRIALLTDQDMVFNFLNSTSGVSTGAGGHSVMGSAGNYLGVIGNNIAMTAGFLGPCGMNTPHVHPRATEINFSVNGSLRTGILTENGARFIVNEVPAGSATVFPMGAIHFEMNTGCEPALFVAAFNNEDPGSDAVAQRYFGLPPDIVGAALGGLGVQEVAGLASKIPDNIALGTDECLSRCGITRSAQPTLQLQTRIAGNAFPSGVSTLPVLAASPTVKAAIEITSMATYSSTTPSSTSSSNAAPSVKEVSDLAVTSNAPSSNVASNTNDNRPILIALVVINGVLVAGILGGLFAFLRQRAHRDTHAYVRPSIPEFKGDTFEPESEPTYYDPYKSRKLDASQ